MLLPYLVDRPLNLHRFPDGVDRRASGRSRRRSTRPTGSRGGTTTTPTRARASSTSSPTARRRSRGSRTTPRSSCTRGRRASPDVHGSRPTRSSTSTRARRRPGTSCSRSPGCTAPRSSTSACAATRRSSGRRGHPDLGPDRARVRRSTTRGVGRAALAHRRGESCRRPRELDVGEAGPRRPRPARLHAERDQQDARRALQRARPRRARRCRCRSRGTSSTIPTSRPTAGRSARAGDRIAEVGDLMAPMLADRQHLPRFE